MPKRPRNHVRKVEYSLEPTVSDRLSWLMLVLIIAATAAISAAVTHFFESTHYSNLLQQSYAVNGHLQNQQNHQQDDLRYLIKNWNGPLNCYPLTSSAAATPCAQHNHSN